MGTVGVFPSFFFLRDVDQHGLFVGNALGLDLDIGVVSEPRSWLRCASS